jgi:hypothetical protein
MTHTYLVCLFMLFFATHATAQDKISPAKKPAKQRRCYSSLGMDADFPKT